MRERRSNLARQFDRRAALAGAAALVPLFCFEEAARARTPSVETPYPGPRDTCPVCGMFVARYPHWVAVVVFQDSAAAFFDGAKDFFKFVFDVGKYALGRSRDQIVTMAVTDYYSTERIGAQDAFYVVGSDVLGPMGHELAPHADEADARDFMKDHAGKRILRFSEIGPSLLEALDAGRFE